MNSLSDQWKRLETIRHGLDSDGDVGDGIILCLMRCGLSFIEIRSVLPVGGYRLSRLKHFTGYSTRSTRKPVYHAFNNATVDVFKTFIDSLHVEDGFPCAHRRPKFYVITEKRSITWKEIYHDYCEFAKQKNENSLQENIKVMALSTFREYKNWLYPGHMTERKIEDVCYHCVRLQLIIDNPLSSEIAIDQARKEKDMHLSAAVDQRRSIKKFTLKYMETLNLPVQRVDMPDFEDGPNDGGSEELVIEEPGYRDNLLICTEIDEDNLEDNLRQIDQVIGVTCADECILPQDDPDKYGALVLAEDYGQGIAMPHYGMIRTQSDYFNSNLMIHLYVIKDIYRG